MKLRMYVIHDGKAESFLTPFFQKSHGEAERSFHQLLGDEKSLIAKYPEDFDLYYLGEYDDQMGTVVALDSPQHIVKASMLNRNKDH